MTTGLRLTIIACAVISSGSVWAQQQMPSSSPQNVQSAPVTSPKQQQSTEKNQEAASQVPIQNSTAQAPNHQESIRNSSDGRNNNGATHREPPKPEDVTAEYTVYLVFATIALVAATIILAVSTVGLYKQTKILAEQAVDAGKDTKASIAISKEASEAALRSTIVSEQTLMSVHRPLVHVENIGWNRNISGDPPTIAGWHIKSISKNYGQSAAINLHQHLNIGVLDIGDTPANHGYPDHGDGESNTHSGPGASLEQSAFVSKEIFDLAVQKKKNLYAFGWISYSGLINPERRYKTTYCYILDRADANYDQIDDRKYYLHFLQTEDYNIIT